MKANYIIDAARAYLEGRRNRGAWDKGVNDYAVDLLDTLTEYPEIIERGTRSDVEKALLNGAESWSAYSWGGGALIYDQDIAKRLCSPSEYRKTDGGKRRRPNNQEQWLDTQARALHQAARLVCDTIIAARGGTYTAPDGMIYDHNQPTGLYSSRYYARKAASGADVVVKVDGGYQIMTAADYNTRKKQR